MGLGNVMTEMELGGTVVEMCGGFGTLIVDIGVGVESGPECGILMVEIR